MDVDVSIQKVYNKQWASAVVGMGDMLVNEIDEVLGTNNYSRGQRDSEGRPWKEGMPGLIKWREGV